MKKRIGVSLIVLLAVGFIAIEAAAQTVQKPKVFELKYATFLTPAIARAPVDKEWIRRIEEQSKGRIKITIYWGGSLLNYNDTLKGVGSGIADIGFVGFTPGLHYVNLVTNLPFVSAPTMQTATRLYHEIYNKYPDLQKEHAKFNMRPIFAYSLPGVNIHLSKKPVRVPQDLKGMKISASASWSEAMASVNCAVVNMPPSEFYMAMERGLVEAQVDQWLGLDSWKLKDLVKHHAIFGENGVSSLTMFGAINLDTWNSLGPELQKIILDNSSFSEDEAMKLNQIRVDEVIAHAKAKNDTFNSLTPEEIQLWEPLFKPYIDKWIKDAESKGFQAKAIYEEAKRLAKQYSK
jgi:TRAP-type C4-dicarboxylate transport system substrate-binding protein